MKKIFSQNEGTTDDNLKTTSIQDADTTRDKEHKHSHGHKHSHKHKHLHGHAHSRRHRHKRHENVSVNDLSHNRAIDLDSGAVTVTEGANNMPQS